MTKRFRNRMQQLAAAAAFLCVTHAQAAPINLPIVSDSTWRSTSVAPGDWTAINFDDSAWNHAYAPYPNGVTTPADIAGGPTAAQLMWDWPGPGAPDGQNGPDEAWFRYTFDLALTPDALPVLGQALVIADDEFEMFVNGIRYDFGRSTALSDNKRANGQPNPLLADFTSLLRNGTNVLAIHAADGSLAAPHDELYEYVFFDGRIRTVPEPGSVLLLLSGCVLMTGALGRRRRGR
jgi:hypothetical protein